MDLSEYKTTLRLDPRTVNTGTWYARSTVHHNGMAYTKGQQLPNDGDHALTNEQVAQLLDVNALTSVAPKETETVPVPPHNGAPNQQGLNDDGVAHGNNQAPTAPGGPTAAELEASGRTERLDENGNPVNE